MLVILRYKGYKIFFFSNESDPRESLHVHVRKADASAKFWVLPQVGLAKSYGLNSLELSEPAELISDNQQLIEKTWHELFG